MSAKTESLRVDVSRALDRIARRFTGPTKITIVVRSPELGDDCDVVITNDEIGAAIEALYRAEERERPYVCPGCLTVGGGPCAPGCIDDAIEREREEERGRDPEPTDDEEYDPDP